MKAVHYALMGILLASGAHAEPASGHRSVTLHPFQIKMPSGFQLNHRSADAQADLSLEEQGEGLIRDLGVDNSVLLRSKSRSHFNLYQDRRFESEEFAYEVDGFPICDMQLKIHRTLDGQSAVMGEYPEVKVEAGYGEHSWADLDDAARVVGEDLVMTGKGTDFSIQDSSRCLQIRDGQLHPVWDLEVNVGGLNYRAMADGERVLSFDPKHFHATGSAKIFESNTSDASLSTFPLREMDETAGGRLKNRYFETCVPGAGNRTICSPADGTPSVALAAEADYNYEYAVGSNEFVQLSAFTNVNRTLEWLEDHGYKNFDADTKGRGMKVLVHAVIGGDINNALYQPGTPPSILVGDGDGEVLANLGTDADVVGHELGHHVVYHTVTNIAGESLVIHEALADFFTFARTGNACLGESICTGSSIGLRVCSVPRQCLRTAENNLTLTSANLPTQAHLRGQFVSGMLWDLNKTDSIPLDDVTTLVLEAIDLLVANSGYEHLVLGLLLADKASFESKYCSTILARAKARGLSSVLTDVSCDSLPALTPSNTEVPGSTGAAPAAAKKSSSKKACGVLSSAAGSGQFGGFLLIWILPLFIAWIRRFRS